MRNAVVAMGAVALLATGCGSNTSSSTTGATSDGGTTQPTWTVEEARFADGTLVVKRATERRSTRTGGPGWWLLSDNPDEGVDSRHRGVVGDADVVAVVLARVWPRPRRRLR